MGSGVVVMMDTEEGRNTEKMMGVVVAAMMNAVTAVITDMAVVEITSVVLAVVVEMTDMAEMTDVVEMMDASVVGAAGVVVGMVRGPGEVTKMRDQMARNPQSRSPIRSLIYIQLFSAYNPQIQRLASKFL